MSDTCYCYEPAEFYHAVRPIARKEHKCYECSRTIRPGERYERVRAKWDYGPQTYKTCVYCLAMRDLLKSRLSCFCWYHGNLLDDMYLAVEEDAYRVPGIAMAFGRLVVEARDAEAS